MIEYNSSYNLKDHLESYSIINNIPWRIKVLTLHWEIVNKYSMELYRRFGPTPEVFDIRVQILRDSITLLKERLEELELELEQEY